MLALLVLVIIIAISGLFFVNYSLQSNQMMGINEYDAVAMAISKQHNAVIDYIASPAHPENMDKNFSEVDKSLLSFDPNYTPSNEIHSIVWDHRVVTYLDVSSQNKFNVSEVIAAMDHMNNLGYHAGISKDGCVKVLKDQRDRCLPTGAKQYLKDGMPTFITQLK